MKRPDTIKVDCSSILGEGASLTWKRLTWGERKAARAEYDKLSEDQQEAFAEQFILDHLTGWNWPGMELPKATGDLDALYPEEKKFLYTCFGKALWGELGLSDEDLKN